MAGVRHNRSSMASRLRAGLSAVAEVERELARFTDEELADAEQWARETIERSRRTAAREQRAA